MKEHYLLIIEGDIEPTLEGPFISEDARDERAKELHEEDGDDNGYFMFSVDKDGVPEVNSYSGAFFDDEEGEN